MKYYIYKIENKIDGKVYIGQHSTNDLEDGYFGSGTYLKSAIKKHGKDNFYKEIIEFCCDKEELNKREIYWIDVLNTMNEGYNLTKGGDGCLGLLVTEETKSLLREYAIKQFDTEEKRLEHSKVTKKGMTDEVKRKISERTKVAMTDEVKRKLSEKKKKYMEESNFKEEHSNRMKEWNTNNKEWRETHNKKLKELWSTEERKEYARERALKQFEDPTQREGARQRAKGNQNNAKEYMITYPNGTKQKIRNLSKFARDNDLNLYKLKRTIYEDKVDNYKGYKVEKVSN